MMLLPLVVKTDLLSFNPMQLLSVKTLKKIIHISWIKQE